MPKALLVPLCARLLLPATVSAAEPVEEEAEPVIFEWHEPPIEDDTLEGVLRPELPNLPRPHRRVIAIREHFIAELVWFTKGM